MQATAMIGAMVLLVAAGGAAAQPADRVVNRGTPAPDCSARPDADRGMALPGYLLQRDERALCVPFAPSARLIPPDFESGDFYAERFTDVRIRARWAECRAQPACAAKVRKAARPFVAFEARDTGSVDPAGRIDPETQIDLRPIRRPAYFAKAPYREPIAAAHAQTSTIEFKVPRDSYERRQLKLNGPIRLRGWYLTGAGVDDGVGGRMRALVVMNGGGGSELTAIDDPRVPAEPPQGTSPREPAAPIAERRTEEAGQRHWRALLQALHAAGFDVLATDRRGNGISGGVSGHNTAEQGNDIFRQLEQLDTGDGLRLLTPAGELLVGRPAVQRLFGERGSAQMPVVLGGYSRGAFATAWAMHRNFVEDCDLDRPDPVCRPALGRARIKGAMLFGGNAGGLGYRNEGDELIEAALRSELDTVYRPDSGVFANIGRWPGVLIARGLWDDQEGLEASFDAWQRAREPKDIVVFRGGHWLGEQSDATIVRVGARMVAFAHAAVLGRSMVPGALRPADLKALVLSSDGN
jgi:pimeloyl-ACP methyl ester carboxylesterase